jgi:transcriptional regulator with XRE-family HTH domain
LSRHPVSSRGEVSESKRGSGLPRVDPEAFGKLLDVCGVTNAELARATGYSKGYVSQVRTGRRSRVSHRFADAAAEYLALRLGETVIVARLLFAPERPGRERGRTDGK